MPENSFKGIEMGRAEFAYKKVIEAKKKLSGDDSKKYKAYVKRIPMLIKTNGLGSTFAFIMGKGENAYNLIYEQTTEWFRIDKKKLIVLGEDDLVKTIIGLESADYRAATIEVLALFNWLRRFADGTID